MRIYDFYLMAQLDIMPQFKNQAAFLHANDICNVYEHWSFDVLSLVKLM